MQTHDIDYRAEAVNLRGYLAFDETTAGRRPGVLVFHEQVRQGWFILGEVLSAAVIVAGVVMLARSPLLADDAAAKPERSQEEPAVVRQERSFSSRTNAWLRPLRPGRRRRS